MVVWSKRDALVVCRRNYQATPKLDFVTPNGASIVKEDIKGGDSHITCMDWDEGVGSINESLYVREANRLLDGLGPRFIDWWWRKPLPVDADLLPEIVPDFKSPFRLCPPQERPKLRDDELTYLRKLARPLPTHFALGNNIPYISFPNY